MNNCIKSLMIFILLIAIMSACGNGFYRNTSENSSKFYTACNIWFENPQKISSINHKRGGIIPAGTEVNEIEFGTHRRYETISFNTVKPEREFTIYWNSNHHAEKTVRDYAEQLFTPKNFSELTTGLTDDEIKSICSGRIKRNMSKQAVLISYGYPPEKETFSTDCKIWTYWTSRMVKKRVEFNDENRISKIGR